MSDAQKCPKCGAEVGSAGGTCAVRERCLERQLAQALERAEKAEADNKRLRNNRKDDERLMWQARDALCGRYGEMRQVHDALCGRLAASGPAQEGEKAERSGT